MKVFRLYKQVWIYEGEVDISTGQSTFGELLPNDRVSHDFPSVEEDCEMMDTAAQAGLV